jgi:hypothetical protein
LSHSISFFVMGFFEIGSWELFAQAVLQTQILLISASWVARNTGVSYCASPLIFLTVLFEEWKFKTWIRSNFSFFFCGLFKKRYPKIFRVGKVFFPCFLLEIDIINFLQLGLWTNLSWFLYMVWN